MDNLYDLLGINKDASEDDIRKAYYKLARKYHPDKNQTIEAAEMFKKISHANEILSDPSKRKMYDLYGEDQPQLSGINPFDIMRQQQQRKPIRQLRHKIILADYFTKNVVRVKVPREIDCAECNATGFTDKQVHRCKQCGGTGLIVKTFRQGPIMQQIQSACPSCKGSKINLNSSLLCTICHGMGKTKIIRDTDVNVPSDILRNPVAMLEEMDVAIIFQLKMQKFFGISSDKKLIYTMYINYVETICGFRRGINHPSGKKLLIVAEKGYIINPDNIYVLEGMGLDAEAMYIVFIVQYPETILLPKKKVLNFDNLEVALGQRQMPPESDDGIEPECIYALDTLRIINNNPRSKEEPKTESSSSSEESSDDIGNSNAMPGVHFNGINGINGCAQQ